MEIKISFTLNMNDEQMHAWANEYGLDMGEVSSDATGHIGEIVQATVKSIPHVQDFTRVTGFTVK
jgi:hypothetical protein